MAKKKVPASRKYANGTTYKDSKGKTHKRTYQRTRLKKHLKIASKKVMRGDATREGGGVPIINQSRPPGDPARH